MHSVTVAQTDWGRSKQRKRQGKMTDFVKVASGRDQSPAQARLIDVKGKQIAVFNINGDFFAIDNICTHEEASLAEGEISGHEVTCPLPNSTFGPEKCLVRWPMMMSPAMLSAW
jgi:3-phenylpropionate/trans-cinnamate dioxygenase ferredoxin subunit